MPSLYIRKHPLLFELNARLWARRPDRDAALEAAAEQFDLVWLMGVWRRSAAARAEALRIAGLRRAYTAALGDWTGDDVDGSPYAIAGYDADLAIVAAGGLAAIRERIGRSGARLIVDFVPNHVARDHPWTLEHPEWFVSAADLDADLGFETAAGHRLAHGRDPNFGPWTDTAQIDISVPAARGALIDTLLQIATVADGVRCDMAMLLLSDVFARTWGRRPDRELWPAAIAEVRRHHPDFVFIAEAYWDLEPALLEAGFDFAYDKDLYDRVRWSPETVTGYLESHRWIDQAVHFVENHDEPRAVEAFAGRGRAAAVASLTLPGLRLFHDGQLSGRAARLPVQLVREPGEPADPELARFYDRLVGDLNYPVFHRGLWRLIEPAGPAIAWCWIDGADARIVAVNLSAEPLCARLELPPELAGARVEGEVLSGRRVELDGGALVVELAPGDAAITALQTESASRSSDSISSTGTAPPSKV